MHAASNANDNICGITGALQLESPVPMTISDMALASFRFSSIVRSYVIHVMTISSFKKWVSVGTSK